MKMKGLLHIFTLFSVTLILDEIIDTFGAALSPDELNIPYVPYVVVEKSKNNFDFDHAQETIVKYLQNRSHRQTYEEDTEQSTTLYDFLRTSTNPPDIKPLAEKKNVNLYPSKYHSLRHLETVVPTTIRFHQSYRHTTTPATSFNTSSINKSYDTFISSPNLPAPMTDLAVLETKYHPLNDPASFVPFKEMPNIAMDGPLFNKYPTEGK